MGWRKAKQFQCIICKKDFSKESPLKKHVKDAHGMEYAAYLDTLPRETKSSTSKK